jgi:hypothetical protein
MYSSSCGAEPANSCTFSSAAWMASATGKTYQVPPTPANAFRAEP